MLPVAKIVAANITKLIDQLQDRPDREVLAGKMGMSGKTLGNLRAGSGNPTLKNLSAAAKYLKVQPWELLHPDRGAASQSAGLDVAKLADLLGSIEAALKKFRAELSPKKKARLVATLYADKEASAAASPEAVEAMLIGILATMEKSDEPDATR